MTRGGAAAGEGELVTVAIPARNEEATLGEVLQSVLDQTHQELQVIVVDGASDDRSRSIIEDFAGTDGRVELVDNPDRVIPMAMNLALDRARGRFMVRVDAHCRIPRDYVERLMAHLVTGRWGGVGGRKDARGRTAAGRAIAAVMGSRLAQGNSVYHYGTEEAVVDHIPFGAYPTDLLRQLGGWTETQLVNEDYELDYRVRRTGADLLFDPAISIDWDCRQNVPDLFRQYVRYGRGKVQTLVRHPSSAGLRHFAAPLMVAAVGIGAALSTGRRTRRMAPVLIGPYALMVTAASVVTARRLDSGSEKLWVAPAFLALHMGWGIGFWLEMIEQITAGEHLPADRTGVQQEYGGDRSGLG